MLQHAFFKNHLTIIEGSSTGLYYISIVSINRISFRIFVCVLNHPTTIFDDEMTKSNCVNKQQEVNMATRIFVAANQNKKM